MGKQIRVRDPAMVAGARRSHPTGRLHRVAPGIAGPTLLSMVPPRDALLVFLGGGLGSLLRFIAASALPKTQSGGFPLAILIVNVVGCLVLGGLVGLIGSLALKEESAKALATFIGVGVCGGFTTFSTFSIDALELLREGRFGAFFCYVVLSVVLGIAAAFAGFKAFGLFG